MRILGIVALGAALGGCASSAADIAPAYVSPVAYQSYTCQQLALEAQAISTRAATLSGAQDSQRTKDGVATAAAVVIFWPAAFFVGGDKQTAAELAQMKGQMVAVEQASIAKKCNIQFQGKPSGALDAISPPGRDRAEGEECEMNPAGLETPTSGGRTCVLCHESNRRLSRRSAGRYIRYVDKLPLQHARRKRKKSFYVGVHCRYHRVRFDTRTKYSHGVQVWHER